MKFSGHVLSPKPKFIMTRPEVELKWMAVIAIMHVSVFFVSSLETA
jgi:hypothetical protein